MPGIKWDHSLITGDPLVDFQHQRLFQLLEDVQSSVLHGCSRRQMLAFLEEMARYTVVHFADEETMMQKHNYPGTAAHVARHSELARQAADMVSLYRNGSDLHLGHVSQFLADWLRHHIGEEDQRMAAWIRVNARSTGPKDGP